MKDEISQAILGAQSKVLATTGDNGLNAVPVSAVQIHDDVIWLFNFFMDKTAQNIQKNPHVSFVCWSQTTGYQIKGQVSYQDSGANFETANKWAKEKFPERTLSAVLLLTPEQIHNISI